MSSRTSSAVSHPRRAGRRILQTLCLVGLAALAVFFWRPLAAWFTGGAVGQGDARAPAAEASAHVPARLSEPALEYTRAAFQAYEAVRALLARDSLEGLAARTGELAAALQKAAEAAGSQPAALPDGLRHAAESAARLKAATSLDEARQRFGDVSQLLVSLAAMDPRLQGDWHLFECPMVKGFKQWLQREPDLENPYMGRRMPACGSPSAWPQPIALSSIASDGLAHGSEAISHYTCPMHPAVRQAGPGQCPLCGMDLTPVTRANVESGTLFVDDARRQRIGLKTARLVVAPMVRSIHALGRVTYDEKALVDVTLKLDGYIQELRANAQGEPVKKGDVLFTLYSPELYAAQQEYLLARGGQGAAHAPLVEAARRRLALWGMTPEQLERVTERGEPIEDIPFRSPASGHVIEKNVVRGTAVKAGERLFRIAPLHKVWVEADVYEQDLPRVKVGQPVEVTLPYLPGKTYRGRVGFIQPALNAATRTGRIRIELPNPGLELKPDMYADVRFVLDAGPRLQVPEAAVLYTGPRRLVFVDLGEGRLRPQEVKLGQRGEDTYEVLEGLKAGDVVVTSGNFLVAAESRLRSAADTLGGGGDHATH